MVHSDSIFVVRPRTWFSREAAGVAVVTCPDVLARGHVLLRTLAYFEQMKVATAEKQVPNETDHCTSIAEP